MEHNHNTSVPPATDLRQLFRVHSILTLDELKSALGTQVAMTVFRKLRPLAYLSSYSHRGKYYTLNESKHSVYPLGGGFRGAQSRRRKSRLSG